MDAPAPMSTGAFLPGSARGWGMSQWFHQQGVSSADFAAAMKPEAGLELVFRYIEAEARGWAPDVAREDWVGPHHPSEPEPPPPRFPPT